MLLVTPLEGKLYGEEDIEDIVLNFEPAEPAACSMTASG